MQKIAAASKPQNRPVASRVCGGAKGAQGGVDPLLALPSEAKGGGGQTGADASLAPLPSAFTGWGGALRLAPLPESADSAPAAKATQAQTDISPR